MQVVVKNQIRSFITGRVLKTNKVINPALCVSTQAIAYDSSTKARREKDDCVVRAFMAALEIPYDDAHAWVKKYMKREDRQGTYTSIYLGNVIGKVKNGKRISFYGAAPTHSYLIGGKTTKSVSKHNKILLNPKYKKPTGYTIASFMEQHRTGSYFVIVDAHAVCIKDGKLYGNTGEGQYRINRRVHYVLKIS